MKAQKLTERILGSESLLDAKVTNALTETTLEIFHYQMVLETWVEGLQS